MRDFARLRRGVLGVFALTLLTGGIPGLLAAQNQSYPPPQNQQQPYPPPQNQQQPYPPPQGQPYPPPQGQAQPYPPPQGQPYPPPQNPGPPPNYPPAELDRLVSRVALYPDPLLAQVLAAATYPDQIQPAAQWSDEHHYLRGDDLARAIAEDHLPWDASVQAMLPFPSVLAMMASDMNWTAELGNAFLAQQQDVMDAVQRQRRMARDYGYLRSNGEVVVTGGPYIAITPANPAYVVVPVYNPAVVYYPPRPGFFVGGAIGFGFGVSLGFGFAPWGWGSTHFLWGSHALFIGGAPWGRTWANRGFYVHPYHGFQRWNGPRGREMHQEIPRSPTERNASRTGHARVEEHGGHGGHR